MIGATIGYQFPGGDLSDRFGNNFSAGGIFQWKLRSNWILGVSCNFLFSDEVKERNFLDQYMTPDGHIIDGNGQYASVLLYERGLNIDLKVGKIFSFLGPNPNSGLMTTLGVGYLQHKIKFDPLDSPIPFLDGDYAKGFDRFSSGVSFTEFIGYMNFSNKKLVNFFAGIEFTQAFTKNRRNMNFDTGMKDDNSRTDLLYGIRLGWVFPLYKRESDKIYLN